MRSLMPFVALLLASAVLGAPSFGQAQEGRAPCSSGVVKIEYGDHVLCSISSPSDIDTYRFSGVMRERVRIVVSGLTNNLDVKFEVLDPSGTLLLAKWCATPNPNSRCSAGEDFDLPATGLYTILVSDHGANNSGNYAMNLERLPPPFPYRFVEYGAPLTVNIGLASDHDFLAIEGASGDILRVAVSGLTNNLDVAYVLYGPSGDVLDSSFCNTPNSNSTCSFVTDFITLEEDGRHWLMVYDNGWNNTGNLSVTVSCVLGTCPPHLEMLGSNYCTTNPNSTGGPAFLTAWGSAFATDETLFLYASDVPPNSAGIFFFGPNQTSTPLGDGVRCVGDPVFRLPVVTAGNRGELRFQLDFGSLPGGQQFLSGSTWNLQAWFRDGIAHNTSDGLELTFL